MKLLLVDDEPRALKSLERMLKKIYPEAQIYCADNYKTALKYAEEMPEVAFLDIEMPVVNGIELAKLLQEIIPELNIIFVTAYEQFAREAYALHASGYLTKPYDREEIESEMKNLRYTNNPQPVYHSIQKEQQTPKLRIQCFGNFEVFYNDQPVHFERKGAKEILAYLVSMRGATANRVEISMALWEDDREIERRKTYFRTLILALRNTLKEVDSEDFFVNRRDCYAIDQTKCDCDYYRYLAGDRDPKIQFRGEFMSQYTWGEAVLGQLMDEFDF